MKLSKKIIGLLLASVMLVTVIYLPQFSYVSKAAGSGTYDDPGRLSQFESGDIIYEGNSYYENDVCDFYVYVSTGAGNHLLFSKYNLGGSYTAYDISWVPAKEVGDFDSTGILEQGDMFAWEKCGDAAFYFMEEQPDSIVNIMSLTNGQQQLECGTYVNNTGSDVFVYTNSTGNQLLFSNVLIMSGTVYKSIDWYHVSEMNGTDEIGRLKPGEALAEWEACGDAKIYLLCATTGWYKLDDYWYYFTGDNTKTGIDYNSVYLYWHKIGGKWYYFDCAGDLCSGWFEQNGKWYYLNKNIKNHVFGEMLKGWQKIGTNWYYFSLIKTANYNEGQMLTGWQKIDGKWYYLDTNKGMVIGWRKINGKWYYFDKSGALFYGWLKSGGKWYYMKSDGSMAVSTWINNTYYMKADGTMAVSEWVGKYYVDENGKYVKGKTK